MATDSALRAIGAIMPGRAQVGHAASAPPTAAGRAPPPPRPLSLRANLAVAAALTVAALLVIQLLLPSYDGKPGLGMPFWGSALCVAYAFAASFGCALIYATSGQQFVGGAAILAQVVWGLLVPGSARANILAVMIVNVAVSQAVSVLGDMKTALYLGVAPRAMLHAQLLGALVGVLASAATYLYVLQLNDEGVITLGSAEWPAVGALSQTLNAKIFGEQGPGAILHGPLLYLVAGCAAVSAAGTIALSRVPPDRWYKKWLPDPTMLGAPPVATCSRHTHGPAPLTFSRLLPSCRQGWAGCTLASASRRSRCSSSPSPSTRGSPCATRSGSAATSTSPPRASTPASASPG